jgi:hypothetical protein
MRTLLFIGVAMLWLQLANVAHAQVALSEDFEGTLDPKVTILSSGNLSPAAGVAPSAIFGSTKAVRFGKSSCGSNCYNSGSPYAQPYWAMIHIDFQVPYLLTNISFKWAELSLNKGSGGYVFLDQQLFGTYPSEYIGIAPPSQFQDDPSVKLWDRAMTRTATTVDILIWDIANLSEIWVDDVIIEGSVLQAPPIADAGPDQTIYIGYGPQSVTLTGTVTGGNPPYQFAWSNAQSGASISVSPTVTTSYTLTVTDAANRSASDVVEVSVVDVRCGQNMNKVLVCHQGNTLCIAAPAVPAHLSIGDQLGPCDPSVSQDNVDLSQNYPNPYNPVTSISYRLAVDGAIRLVVYDWLGREVRTLVDEFQHSGIHVVRFDASALPSGTYFYRMIADGVCIERPMILLK